MRRGINRKTAVWVVASLLWLGLAPLEASADVHGVTGWQLAANQDWESLSPEERQLLQAYRSRWSSYSYEQQQRLREGAQRYLQLTPEEQRAVVRERQRFERLPPEERRSLREKYRRSRGRD